MANHASECVYKISRFLAFRWKKNFGLKIQHMTWQNYGLTTDFDKIPNIINRPWSLCFVYQYNSACNKIHTKTPACMTLRCLGHFGRWVRFSFVNKIQPMTLYAHSWPNTTHVTPRKARESKLYAHLPPCFNKIIKLLFFIDREIVKKHRLYTTNTTHKNPAKPTYRNSTHRSTHGPTLSCSLFAYSVLQPAIRCAMGQVSSALVKRLSRKILAFNVTQSWGSARSKLSAWDPAEWVLKVLHALLCW